MEPTLELIDALEREDVAEARRLSPSARLRAGGDLFDEACRWLLAGIRNESPSISPEAARIELFRRLTLADEQGD